MEMQPKPNYLYLDDEPERRRLITEFHKVRQAVLSVVESVPESDRYEPRYHGWSLAAMLAHLNTIDRLYLWLMKAALINIRIRITTRRLTGLNDFCARLYRKRLVRSSIKSMKKNEARIADFVLHLPVTKFSKAVYHAEHQQFTTIERAIQDLFLFHWEEHLKTMREVEGIQPPEQRDN